MLLVNAIFPLEKSDWIDLVIIKKKKVGEYIRICVDFCGLNTTSAHDLFSTPFSDNVLVHVVRKEIFPFTDGFERYHEV
jgi:hypothetical protein